MFVSIVELQIRNRVPDTLSNRIENDLIPIYKDANGFIAYLGVKQSENSLETVRVFEDEASLKVALGAADSATQQIINGFQLEATEQTHAEASVAHVKIAGA
jgi:hypothetical protein